MYEITKKDIGLCDYLTVKYCARVFKPVTDDLIQTGREGMCRAAQKFDINKKVSFWGYAKWWVRAYIYNDLFAAQASGKIKNSCVFRHNLTEKIASDNKGSGKNRELVGRRTVEDAYIDFDECQKALTTMTPTVQSAVIGKGIYGINFSETSKYLGYSERSLVVMLNQWRKGTHNAVLKKHLQKKHYGENPRIKY